MPVLGIKTLDDIDVSGKHVLVRVDFNSPIDPQTGRILDDTRIRTHGEKTIRELVDRRAKITIIAHQGRKGEPDFVSLSEHARVLERVIERPVKFVDDIFGEKAVDAIKSLKEGDVLLLENVRFWDGETTKAAPEEHAKSELVKRLAPLFDVFVMDAFAAAHRLHASIVGFIPAVSEIAVGRVMEAELKALERVRNNPRHPCVYILGGAKAEDSANVARAVLSQGIADYVLTGGLVANLFLHAQGHDLGKPNASLLEKKGFIELVPEVKKLLADYGDRVILPVDLAIDKDGRREIIKLSSLPTPYAIKDIGDETIETYAQLVERAETIVMNGPMGVFEEEAFATGTAGLFEAISRSKGFSLIGGGHTIAAAKTLGYSDKVSFISTGGGALMRYLSKGTLPVIEALKRYGR